MADEHRALQAEAPGEANGVVRQGADPGRAVLARPAATAHVVRDPTATREARGDRQEGAERRGDPREEEQRCAVVAGPLAPGEPVRRPLSRRQHARSLPGWGTVPPPTTVDDRDSGRPPRRIGARLPGDGIGAARLRQADDAARLAGDPGDVEALVGIESERLGVAAMARAIRIVDDTERSLLDVLA